MKVIIHGGFFSESDSNEETKIAKQEALIIRCKTSIQLSSNTYCCGNCRLCGKPCLRIMNCLMQD